MRKSNLDLEQSFRRWKPNLTEAHKPAFTIDLFDGMLDAYKILKKDKQDAAAEAFGLLSIKVKEFLVKSTDLTLEDIDNCISNL